MPTLPFDALGRHAVGPWERHWAPATGWSKNKPRVVRRWPVRVTETLGAHLSAILIRVAAVRRICAKVLLIDPDDRVLLFSGIDRTLPDDPPVWFPVGGAVEAGETLEAAAIRETREETGFEIDEVGPVLFTCRFEWVFEGSAYDQEETYFLVRVPGEAPTDGGCTEVEKATVVGHRWWAVADLRCTSDTVHPHGLADLLDRFL